MSVIDPERIPEIRPDRRRFWLLRGLCWLFFFAGLALFIFGGFHATLVYYGTKNGAELDRIVRESAYILASLLTGLLLMTVGQVCRVVIAIEENLRIVAYNTRARLRPIPATSAGEAERRPQAQSAPERLRV